MDNPEYEHDNGEKRNGTVTSNDYNLQPNNTATITANDVICKYNLLILLSRNNNLYIINKNILKIVCISIKFQYLIINISTKL